VTDRLLPWAVTGLVLLVAPWCSGCSSPESPAGPPAAATGSTAAGPTSPAGLEELLLDEVPSGLPLVPDDELDPPAGEKTLDDIAGYSVDPRHERRVLEDHGYRFGWERFWGDSGSGRLTSVFVDQFEHRSGAVGYAADLARNEAEHYGAILIENAPELPGGCHLLTVKDGDPGARRAGPAALVWCGHGVFSVSVTVMAGSVDAAERELRAVLGEQLDRLPPG
jgi:hypothetical protein